MATQSSSLDWKIPWIKESDMSEHAHTIALFASVYLIYAIFLEFKFPSLNIHI